MTDQRNKDNLRLGLSTEEALKALHDEIVGVLKVYEDQFDKESWIKKVRTAFFKPYESPLHWFGLFSSIVAIVLLCSSCYFFSGFIVTVILVVNIFIVVRESNLRRTEMYRKVRNVLADIQQAVDLSKDWTINNYPHLCSPLSPCVTLQWTYRDHQIVNLPWALLVRGDYIVIRPGQVSPGICTEINGIRHFKGGETYTQTQPTEPPRRPTARTPLPDMICILETTPYLENLRTSLDNFLKRPATIYNQQRHLLITNCIQKWGFLVILLLTISFGAIVYNEMIFPGKFKTPSWMEAFIERPICAVIPILPLIFPAIWIGLNLWGIAKLETLLSKSRPLHERDLETSKVFQEDLDSPTVDWDNIILPWQSNVGNWLEMIQGSSNLLGRSAKVVQVLGSITALTCVDKKGILSFPNPTAEKVFFLRDSSDNSSTDTSNGSSIDSDDQAKGSTVAEVLDLTSHDHKSAFALEFDDARWKNHINSLKPLGLAILVNTCCPLTQAHYAQFCGHVTAVALFDKDLIPVTNRYEIVESSLNSFMHGRCLCELAKQIGFTKQAREIFSLEGKVASYRHLQPDVVRRDIRFARSLQLASKVKVPFPHSLSVVMKENTSGSLQLLTQGTADIILDCCDDFWDGKDLRPLGPQDRKRAQDFYQRSALTAYCTAFAYRPLRHGISGALAGTGAGEIAYLELPPESKYKMIHADKVYCDFESNAHPLNHSISTDSLLFTANKDDYIADVEGCFEMQCHQVFIGMVTMQYQAQSDVVQLVERLDRACIRFVHFSKENELRSRVFSEKMGLESGWNCHISLLSDDHSNIPSPKSSRNLDPTAQYSHKNVLIVEDEIGGDHEISRLLPPSGLESNKNLSSSAPGAISNQECGLLQAVTANNSNDSFEIELRHRSSKDSAMECGTHEENCRSLSCLTDSTESAPVHFDMSNRAKLPRGIENIRPHLENVDNVPLLVSLFTDCSAEATREMLNIMQSYGEIVVCLGSSASNANAEIFLQADCSIGIEPLYPQVCQDYPAYTEANIYHNKKPNSEKRKYTKWFESTDSQKSVTISPIYLSRMLNSISCSIAVCRDDPLPIVAIVELSRRFTVGLWNCLQFMMSCACSLTLMNTVCAGLGLPPMMTPITLLYLMCVAIPAISISLTRIAPDPKTMTRATGKKQTKINSQLIFFVIWCYGFRFIPPILITTLSFSAFLSHPINLFKSDDDELEIDLKIARCFILLGTVIHFTIISISFVHRDYTIWQKNPFRNSAWVLSCSAILIFHILLISCYLLCNHEIVEKFDKKWPIIVFLLASTVITFANSEIIKWEEIKVNSRYQRRARLDFGTKLGMNSPF